MGSASTVYDVQVNYALNNKAGRGLEDIAKKSDKAAFSLHGLHGVLAAVGAFEAFKLGNEHLIQFNSHLEQAKITMAGLVEGMHGGDFNSNLTVANKLVDQLQQRSKATTSTTMELVHMAESITAPVMQAGGSMKDLENFTVGASVAAKAMGANADYAALEITEALQGNWTKRARFMNMLMAPMHIDHNKFNAMSESERFGMINKALNSKSLKDMAEAQRNSFAGVTSTLKDNIEIALGKIGLPLFKAMSKEIGSWNKWFDEHPHELEAIMTKASNALMTGFKFVKSVFEFIWDHREVIADLLKVAIAWKAVNLGIGAGKGLAGMFTGLNTKNLFKSFTELGMNADGVSSKFRSIAAASGPLAVEVGAFVALGYMIYGSMERDRKAREENTRNTDYITETAAELGRSLKGPLNEKTWNNPQGQERSDRRERGNLFLAAQQSGLVFKNMFGKDQINEQLLAASVGRQQEFDALRKVGLEYKLSADELVASNQLLAGRFDASMNRLQDSIGFLKSAQAMALITAGEQKVEKALAGPAKRADVNVTIQRIEVASEDPDRFVFGMVRAVENITKNPTQSHSVIAGGF